MYFFFCWYFENALINIKNLSWKTWHESCTPFPAHIIFAVILDGLYLVLRHWFRVRIGTCTSCMIFAKVPPSDVRPQPTTIPVSPAGSSPEYNRKEVMWCRKPVKLNLCCSTISYLHLVNTQVEWFLKNWLVFAAWGELYRGYTNSHQNDDASLSMIQLSSQTRCRLSQFDHGLPI